MKAKKFLLMTALLLPVARGFLRQAFPSNAQPASIYSFRRYPSSQQTRCVYYGTSPSSSETAEESQRSDWDKKRYDGTVTILDRGKHHLVVAKPPAVLCHHSDWAGSRSKKRQVPEIPMLQRVRQAVGERVNVIHRLDRGCSGCLLFAYVSSEQVLNATATLSDAIALDTTTKTYIAIVRGEGILHGRDFRKEGWFEVTRPVKNEKGNLHNATTHFRFLAGQDSITHPDRPRASLVLARPQSGRWHQIRRHLNGLSHPILGDSTHGNSQVNREWKALGMPGERTCLHLARIEMDPNAACPNGIDVSCPLPEDMMDMLATHLPGVLEEALPLLEEENIQLTPKPGGGCKTELLPYTIYQ